MSWLDRLRQVFRPQAAFGAEWTPGDIARINMAGLSVTEHTALSQAAVWACVRVIAESLAMLPIDIVERRGDRREVQDNAQGVGWLLNYTPDGERTAFDLRCAMAAHVLLWGNAYAEIERDLAGRPYALHLLEPDRVEPRREDGVLVYRVWGADNRWVQLDPRNVLHWRGLGWDGLVGYSVVGQARQSLSTGAALETFGAAFFGNGTHPSGVLTTDRELSKDQRQQLREEWERVHKGPRSANKTAILGGGLKWEPMTMPLADSQFLESRRFQVLEVARWFRVSPHLLAELERATHSNVEQEQLAFVTHCLQPWAARFEAEANIKLMGRNQQARLVVKHNFGGLLRADFKGRQEGLQIMRRNGVISANEWRALEDRNPIGADGDVYIVEGNMSTIERIEDPPEPSSPAPAPVDDNSDAQLASARARMRVVRS